jgi:hypothetical protein
MSKACEQINLRHIPRCLAYARRIRQQLPPQFRENSALDLT